MALTLYFEVSPGTASLPPSVADGAFAALGAPAPDTGGGATLDNTQSGTPPVQPGVLYAYRARRYDDATGLYSPYSEVAFARAPLFFKENSMEGILDSVIVGGQSEIGIGLEAYEGFAVKAQKKLEYRSGGPKRTINTLFAKPLVNRPTMRRKSAPGTVMFEGQMVVEVTPEGGWLLLLAAFLSDVVAGAVVPFTHTFANKFGAKSVTLYQKEGNVLKVYPGCRVQSIQFNNLAAEPTDIVTANVNVLALNEVVYDLSVDPGAYARCGMDTAGLDPLPPYSGVEMVSFIANVAGTVRTFTLSITKEMGKKKTATGKRGYSAHFETKTEIAASAEVYFENISDLLRDYGQPAPSAAPVGNTVAMATINAPFSLIFAPPNNASGFSNTFSIVAPSAIYSVNEDVKDEKEIVQTLTFQTVDDPASGAGTDFYLAFVNSVSQAGLFTPAAPVPNFPSSAVHNYFCAAVNAAPAPTTTVFTTDTVNTASLAASNNYAIYLAKSVLFLSGANVGLSRPITAYTAPTGGVGAQFTVATAFPSAPGTGDIFTVA